MFPSTIRYLTQLTFSMQIDPNFSQHFFFFLSSISPFFLTFLIPFCFIIFSFLILCPPPSLSAIEKNKAKKRRDNTKLLYLRTNMKICFSLFLFSSLSSFLFLLFYFFHNPLFELKTMKYHNSFYEI